MTNTKKSLNGGFVMLLMLLIGVAITIFLIVKSIASMQERTGVNNNPDTNVEPGGGLAPINAAKNAKNLIEQDNKRAAEQLQ